MHHERDLLCCLLPLKYFITHCGVIYRLRGLKLNDLRLQLHFVKLAIEVGSHLDTYTRVLILLAWELL
jgi:hypothetical protein